MNTPHLPPPLPDPARPGPAQPGPPPPGPPPLGPQSQDQSPPGSARPPHVVPPRAAVPSPPDPADPDQRPGQYHVTEKTRTFPCANCGDGLEFDPVSGALRCPSCNSSRPIERDPRRQVGEHDLRDPRVAALATPRGLLSRDDPAAADEHEVICQNCGGRTVFTGTLTATRCPYCASSIQRDDVHQAPETIPVDGVVPFGVGDDQARANIEAWINSRWFAPSEFKKYRQFGSFSSVYFSFFAYSATAYTDYHGQRGDNYTVTVGSGDNQHTETRIRWRSASGRVVDDFRDVPALVNTGVDPERVEQLKPWPIDRAQPFTGEYLAGHLARTYDVGPEDGFGIARREEIDPTIEHTIRRDIGGDHQRIASSTSSFDPLRFRYLLMPIWLLTVVYGGKPFQVYINGVTGEVQGDRPYSAVKIAAAVITVLTLIALVVVAYRMSQ